MSDIYGIPIHTSRFLEKDVQVKFPRTKKKRMQKKWSKQKKNYIAKPDTETVYVIDTSKLGFGFGGGKQIICHPDLATIIQEKLEEER